MEISDLLKVGAELIRNNSDESTTELDQNSIADALGSILGGGDEGGLDLGSIVGKLSEGGSLSDVVASWIGQGENLPIDASTITDLLGSEKISEFASQLGLSEESAAGALADVLPNIVDQATNDESVLGSLLDQVGGIDGALDMVKGFFNK